MGVSPISGTSRIAPRPRRERRLGGAEIDLRLSAARDAVQQERAEARVAHGRQKIGERPLLVLGGNYGQRLAGRQFRGRPQLALRIEAQRSLLRQPVDGAPQRRPIAHEVRHAQAAARRAQARDDLGLRRAARRGVFLDERRDLELAEAGRVDRLLHRHDSVAPQPRDTRLRVAAEALLERAQAQRAVLQVPQQRVVGPSRLHEPHDRTAGAHPRGRQHEPVALARRCQVVVGDEACEVEERRRHERRLVEDLQHLLEVQRLRLRRVPADDADHAPAAEGDEHAHAALGTRRSSRQPVAEGRLEGQRQRDGHQALVHARHSIRRECEAGSARERGARYSPGTGLPSRRRTTFMSSHTSFLPAAFRSR